MKRKTKASRSPRDRRSGGCVWLRLKPATARGRSVAVPVLGEAVFTHPCKSEVRLQGCRYRADAYEEVRPDAYFSRCCGWGHVGPRCTVAAPRCALCEESHLTADHRCPVEGRRVERARLCPHGPGAGAAVAHTSGRLTLAPRRGGPGRRPSSGGRPPLPTTQAVEGSAPGTGHHTRGGRGGAGEAG